MLGAVENLAWGYLNSERYDEALAIFQEYAGRKLGTSDDEHSFGHGSYDTLVDLKKKGKNHPTLGKIEALLRRRSSL